MRKPKLTRGTINSYFNDSAIEGFLQRNLASLQGQVIDIGSGRMRYRSTILSGPNVSNYIGLDLEPGKFDTANTADVYWDGVTMPFADRSIDSAILFEVLEHCADPRIVAKEAYRVLQPGGTLLFSTPFLYQLHGFPHDYQRPTPSGLHRLLSDAGFTHLQLFPSGTWDASLGQMIGIWITHRPMPIILRKIFATLFVPVFSLLLWLDRRRLKNTFADNDIMPGILGIAQKPL
jgi:SAM-dependent methyltransferase